LSGFYDTYSHLDPNIIVGKHEGIIFLDIAKSKEPSSVIKHRLNNYVNIKFNDVEHWKSYSQNMVVFKNYSIIASEVINDLLQKAAFPNEITDTLRETEVVKTCYDFRDLLDIYKSSNVPRVRFEVLRKLGIIVLIARINRSIVIEDLDTIMRNVRKAFNKGLGVSKKRRRSYYYWLDANNTVSFATDRRDAKKRYDKACLKRRELAMRIFPMQRFVCSPFRTPSGSELLGLELRNKFKANANRSYISFIEKMIRKNLEFPNQIRDVIGVKAIVPNEDSVGNVINDLVRFLGGSSTRKREKNTYVTFGKKPLSPSSGKQYSVWKAVYDITLPHPSIAQVKRIISMAPLKSAAHAELKKRLRYFKDRPLDYVIEVQIQVDYVIEVQIQDVTSYLLSLAKGSTTDHSHLKRNQIRSNSFYKLFPKIIYQSHILDLKKQILES